MISNSDRPLSVAACAPVFAWTMEEDEVQQIIQRKYDRFNGALVGKDLGKLTALGEAATKSARRCSLPPDSARVFSPPPKHSRKRCSP